MPGSAADAGYPLPLAGSANFRLTLYTESTITNLFDILLGDIQRPFKDRA